MTITDNPNVPTEPIPTEDIDYFSGAPLGRLVYDRTYSRKIHADQCEEIDCSCPKETWPDTIKRMVEGNLRFVDSKFIEPNEREELENLVVIRQQIPAGRHIWVTGVDGRQYVSNCFVAGFETGLAEHAGFMFQQLMCGGGVGANYSSRYLESLTPLSSVAVRFICSPEHADFETLLPLLKKELSDPQYGFIFRIPDSREGWVEALTVLLDAATGNVEHPCTIVYDVSDVRCKGTPIKGFGGVASGPLPLMILLQEVSKLISSNEGTPLAITPEVAMIVDHLIASAVIAGNVRRSARMAIMHWNDPYIKWFLNCKSDYTHHWSTNISVEIDNDFFYGLLDEKSWASFVYEQIIDGMLKNGEPGFFNSSLTNQGEPNHIVCTNPCGEIGLESFGSCFLGHVNLAFGDDADIEKSFRLMTKFLLRSTFCDKVDPKQQDVVERTRRIGVGFFGLQEWLGIRGIPYSDFSRHGILADHLTKWYRIVREEADRYADELGINRPVKCTTVAPTGTIAKLAGTSEGMQPIYARYYLRRVRYAENDPEVGKLLAQGVPVEKDIYTENTVVASFPCEDPILTRVHPDFVEEQQEIPIENLLAIQAYVQRYYADNAISLTVNVPQASNEEELLLLRTKLSGTLKKYLPHLKGTTVFPEASRPQSPIERITKDQYDSMVHAQVNSGESEQLIEDCQGGSCPLR